MTDNSSFQSFLKGLYITTGNTTVNTGRGNILRFNMEDMRTNLTLYYHNTVDTSNTTFTFNSVAHFSNFKHDYSAVDAAMALQLGSTPPAQNDLAFLQPLGGTKIKIEMPYLMKWSMYNFEHRKQ